MRYASVSELYRQEPWTSIAAFVAKLLCIQMYTDVFDFHELIIAFPHGP